MTRPFDPAPTLSLGRDGVSVADLTQRVQSRLSAGDTVAVLGLAHMPHTSRTEPSPGLLVAGALAETGVNVITHDPAARDTARRLLCGAVQYAIDLADAVQAADIIVIATPWPEYVGLDVSILARPHRRRTVVDCWRCLDAAAVQRHADYVAFDPGPLAGTASAARRVA